MRHTCTIALALLTACATPGTDTTDDSGDSAANALPLGLPTTAPGETWAGAAVIAMNPVITETFTDVNGNHLFDGCFDDPDASEEGCDEPYDDADEDGTFDAVFIGGFDPLRPANERSEDITARAWVMTDGGAYAAVVVLDLVGLAHPRIEQAANKLLAEDGWADDSLMVMSTHSHQGPDTMGLWGNPEACLAVGSPDCVPGFDPDYQDQVAEAIVAAVRAAASAVEPVDLRIGRVHMRDVSPWYNGEAWGGVNPVRKMHGMVNDIRDPVVVSDQLLALQATGEEGVVFTWTIWSGHPEVGGVTSNTMTTDFVGVHRRRLEQTFGGIAIHSPESLGGMQSALGGALPARDRDGEVVLLTCSQDDIDGSLEGCDGKTAGDTRTYADGTPWPEWVTEDGEDFMWAHGHALAEATEDVLEDATAIPGTPLRSLRAVGHVAVRNIAYNLLGPLGIFDFGLDDAVVDTTICPTAGEVDIGCVPFKVHRLQIGPFEMGTAPGEVLPELVWGLPTGEPGWDEEAADASKRGANGKWFPQHDPDCDDVPWSQCRSAFSVGDCDCLRYHAEPYEILEGGAAYTPITADLRGEYKAVTSMTSTYLSYIVPSPDVNTSVSLLSEDGDHYEDSVTVSYDLADRYLETWATLRERWDATYGYSEDD